MLNIMKCLNIFPVANVFQQNIYNFRIFSKIDNALSIKKMSEKPSDCRVSISAMKRDNIGFGRRSYRPPK